MNITVISSACWPLAGSFKILQFFSLSYGFNSVIVLLKSEISTCIFLKFGEGDNFLIFQESMVISELGGSV